MTDHNAIAKRAREAELEAMRLSDMSKPASAYKEMMRANTLHRLAYETAIGQYAEGELE